MQEMRATHAACTTHTAYVALGANLGEPNKTLHWAIDELVRFGVVQAVSNIYRTAPVGGPAGQPDYCNAVLKMQTELNAHDLLSGLHQLEAEAGRERSVRWAARTLDLDLILFDRVVINTPELVVPHPRAWERTFVLQPLHDLAPHLLHPCTGESVEAALKRLWVDLDSADSASK